MDVPGEPKLVSREALREMLCQFETIPESHRLYLWRVVLLSLPGNKKEYLTLRHSSKKLKESMAKHSIEEIDQETMKITNRITRCVLAHSPTLILMKDFVGSFIETFSTLLAFNELVYFEAILTILVNYCQHWFDHSPQPPYSLFSMLDIILLKQDPTLYRHMASKGVRCMNYAWKWMSKAFLTITYEKEWVVLWDHILCNEPSFICFLPLAVCRLHSRHIMKFTSSSELMEFLDQVPSLDAESLLREAYQLDDVTPAKLHPGRWMHNFSPLPQDNQYPTVNTNDLIQYVAEFSSPGNLANLMGTLIFTCGAVNAAAVNYTTRSLNV